MVRRIARISLWALLLWLPTLAAVGQRYEISGQCSLSGSITMTVFDGDSSSHTYNGHIDRGLFYFNGTVARPVLASLTHPSMPHPLYFYLENAEITINLNATHPEASLINGSRSNSEYRYLMERYRNEDDGNAFLRQYVREHSADIYAPFILYSHMQLMDEGTLRQLIGQLEGDATHVYHYTLLRRWQRETPSVSEGSEMPNFTFVDSHKNQVIFNKVRNTTGSTLLVVGSSWCDQCKSLVSRAERLTKDKNIAILYIRIDDSPAGWDAPFLKQLSVDHLPYVILVDADGRVLARDIRQWELDGFLR